ncbi:hypothetical protein ABK040_014721 [Willaertia magna]
MEDLEALLNGNSNNNNNTLGRGSRQRQQNERRIVNNERNVSDNNNRITSNNQTKTSSNLGQMSTALLLADLDDFLPVSRVDCIKPLLDEEKNNKNQEKPSEVIVQKPKEKKISKIELSDCLACSGCITSAESILVNQQSIDQFLEIINNNKQVQNVYENLIISLSTQSVASIASFYNISSIRECFEYLSYFFKQHFGAIAVFDISLLSRTITQIEMCEEFIEKFNKNNENQKKNTNLPLFVSTCPGWICYAEKTHGEILPYISTVKSPQQIMGMLVKKFTSFKNIFHVSVMPCFDKKLEASRPDFQKDEKIDMVLTSSEIVELLKRELSIESGKDLKEKLCKCKVDNILEFKKDNNNKEDRMDESLDNEIPILDWIDPNSELNGSGGYCEVVFRYAAKKLFQQDYYQKPLKFETKRNSDYKELILINPENQQVLLKFIIANGFRNIQNLVRRLKNADYHFVEIMACPIGCLNGGGQTSVDKLLKDEYITPKQHLERTENLYKQDLQFFFNCKANSSTQDSLYWASQFKETDWYKLIYNEWLKGDVGSKGAKEVFHTQYHEITSSKTALNW